MDHRGFCYIGKIRSVVILQKSCNESFHNTPQGEILSAVYQHPVSDGIAKEVRTKTNEKYHDDTGEDSTDDDVFSEFESLIPPPYFSATVFAKNSPIP